jgi:hypothetical protein
MLSGQVYYACVANKFDYILMGQTHRHKNNTIGLHLCCLVWKTVGTFELSTFLVLGVSFS